MSGTTVSELISTCDALAKNNELGIDPEIIEDFAETIRDIIKIETIAQHYGRAILDTDGPIGLPDETEVSVETLLKISEELDACSAEDNIFANFSACLKNNHEVQIFDDLTQTYDSYGIDAVINKIQGENLMNFVKKDTPLYTLLILLHAKKELVPAMMEVFRVSGIDIINNPLVALDNDVTEFINTFKNHIVGLIAQSRGKGIHLVSLHSGTGKLN